MLLDRSGSMGGLWENALTAINGYVKELSTDDLQVYLASFDDYNGPSYDVLRDCNAKDWRNITSEETYPRGGTPLNDAAGKLLDKVFKDDPRKAIIVIMTDGYENASKEYSREAIKGKMSIAKERGYEIVFLGANFDNIENLAGLYNIPSNRAMNISASNMGDTMRNFASYNKLYNTSNDATTSSATMDSYFSEENKKKAIDGNE